MLQMKSETRKSSKVEDKLDSKFRQPNFSEKNLMPDVI